MRFTKEVKKILQMNSYLHTKLMSPIPKNTYMGKHIAINVLGGLLWFELQTPQK